MRSIKRKANVVCSKFNYLIKATAGVLDRDADSNLGVASPTTFVIIIRQL